MLQLTSGYVKHLSFSVFLGVLLCNAKSAESLSTTQSAFDCTNALLLQILFRICRSGMIPLKS